MDYCIVVVVFYLSEVELQVLNIMVVNNNRQLFFTNNPSCEWGLMFLAFSFVEHTFFFFCFLLFVFKATRSTTEAM